MYSQEYEVFRSKVLPNDQKGLPESQSPLIHELLILGMYQPLLSYFTVNQYVNFCPVFPMQMILHNLEQLSIAERGLLSQPELGNTLQTKSFSEKENVFAHAKISH